MATFCEVGWVVATGNDKRVMGKKTTGKPPPKKSMPKRYTAKNQLSTFTSGTYYQVIQRAKAKANALGNYPCRHRHHHRQQQHWGRVLQLECARNP